MPLLRAARDAGTVPLGPVVHVVRRMNVWTDSPLYSCELLMVDGPAPELPELRDHIAGRVDRVPALGYALDERRRRWAPAPGFDARAHVTEQRIEPGTDPLTAALDLPPLPPGRPLWAVTLLHGHDPDGYALCYRAHMMFQDGVCAVSTLEALFGRRRLARPAAPGTAASAAPLRPLLSARGWADLAGAMRRSTAWSPDLPPASGHCAVHSVDLDVPEMLAVARATKATLHQVGLASLTGAFRAWMPEEWHKPPLRGDLTVGVTMSLWPADRGTALGGRVGFLPVALPCGSPDPADHLRQVMRQTSEERIRIQRGQARALLGHLPAGLAVLAERLMRQDFVTGCVTTLRVAPGLTVAGAPVRAVLVVPPRLSTLQRLIIATTQYERTVTAVLLVDSSLTGSPSTGPRRLGELWGEALTALHAAHGRK